MRRVLLRREPVRHAVGTRHMRLVGVPTFDFFCAAIKPLKDDARVSSERKISLEVVNSEY